MPTSPLTTYLTQLRAALRTGDATERTHYSTLKELLESLAPGVTALVEPKRIACGAPDFHLRKRDLLIGHVEAKDVGANLDDIAASEQLKDRYLPALPNLLLTNYLEFRWYVDGKERTRASLGRLSDGRISVDREGPQEVAALLAEFLSHSPQGAASAKDLALRLARLTHEIKNIIAEAFRTETASPDLRDLLEVMRSSLLPDLTPEQFADMFAQTLTYGFFAARCNHPLGQPFRRLGAAAEIPKTNPLLRRLFETITGESLEDEPFAGYVDDVIQLLGHTTLPDVLKGFGRRDGGTDPIVHFYETFLAAYDPKLRELRGVYYTPDEVVSYMVRSVDHLLRTRFACPQGLADTSPVAQVLNLRSPAGGGRPTPPPSPRLLLLDPACGTGTFLYAIISHIREQFMRSRNAGAWSSYVRDHLLPRLFGFELLMAPYAVAHLKLGLQLAGQDLDDPARTTWKYDFSGDERLGLYLTNTLDEAAEHAVNLFGSMRVITEEANAAARVKRSQPIMVVIGNPPYSGHSANRSWEIKDGKRVPTFIGNLLQDYYQVDGRPLGEKNPKWLQDDYVKFLRFGQWRIDQTGEGILALITNHSYLDNPTFRGMRQQLLHAFTDIYLLDLHGNSKKKERTPDGGKDQNVFDIQQGVCIALFVKTRDRVGRASARQQDAAEVGRALARQEEAAEVGRALARQEEATGVGRALARQEEATGVGRDLARQGEGAVEEPSARLWHADLWGTRENKYAALLSHDVNSIEWQELHPTSPAYLFVPQDTELAEEYAAGTPVNDIFPVNSVGFVSARDALTIHFSREEAWKTVTDFVSHPAEEAREKYHLGSDVRDWKVAWAQQDVRDSGPDQENVTSTLYRPFDTRYTYYTGKTKGLICMPRREVMKHVLAGTNLGLILPRRVETSGPWQHCLSTRDIADHVAVSLKTIDYLFPLYLYPSEGGLFRRGDPLGRPLDGVQDDSGRPNGSPLPEESSPPLVGPTSRSDVSPARREPSCRAGVPTPATCGSPVPGATSSRHPNLHPGFIAELERHLSLRFLPDPRATGFQPVVSDDFPGGLKTRRTGSDDTFGPEDVFDYLYAILHCPTYRTRYAEFLKRDFPRIPLTSDRQLFASLVSKGRDLVALHLLESPLLGDLSPSFPTRGSNVVERVQYNDTEHCVYINKERQHFADVPPDVWSFQVGGYQVCDKWLKDRKSRPLSYDDLLHYRKIVLALRETLRLMSEIDALIPEWPLQ